MNNRHPRLALMILSVFAFALVSPPVVQAEEPTPGVARVSLIHGDVLTMRGDSGDWVASTVNAPLVRGDKISTGGRSRTEIELDSSNVLRLDQRSEAKIAELTRTHILVQVAQGTVDFTVFKGTEADVEIDTPNVAVHPLGEGTYRIQVNSAAETEVTVRKGTAEVSTPQGSTTVEKNQLITVQGTDSPEYQVAQARGHDEWDRWNSDRDREIAEARSWGYSNRYYTGVHDLDQHGQWVNVPGYDWCWTPYVDAGWVPYHSGRWVWEPYWGWTWVSYEPWGWAPYHYGRWFFYNSAWFWWPGQRFGYYHHFYPTWAPAYVSFIGFGFGGRHFRFGAGFGFGSIGWLPLGPRDTFSPWWGFHNTYNVTNINNITNINNTTNIVSNSGVANQVGFSNLQGALNNIHVRRAITAVRAEDFARGFTPRDVQTVDATALRQAQVVSGTLPVVPTRESLRPINTPVAAPATSSTNQRFFTKRSVAAAPESFDERAAQIREMVQTHNPLAANTTQIANPAPAAVAAPRTDVPVGAAVQAPNRGVGSEGRLNGFHEAAPASQPQRTWQRFGVGNPSVAPAPGGSSTPAVTPAITQPAPQQVAPASQPQMRTLSTGRENPSPRWQRFEVAQPRPQAPAPTPTSVGPASAPAPAVAQPQSQPAASPDRSNWHRFSVAPASRPGPSESAPRASTTPGNFAPQPAPAVSGDQQGRWRQFSRQAQPAPAERSPGFSAPQPAPEGGAGRNRWERFTARPEAAPQPRSQGEFSAPGASDRPSSNWGQRFFHEAPQSAPSRPSLEFHKPIVVERPRSFEASGPSRGGSPPPSGGQSSSSPPARNDGERGRVQVAR